MDQVISNAQSLVCISVLDNHPEEVKAKVTKHLAGAVTPSEIKLVGYSFLSLGGDPFKEAEFRFKPGSNYYLFLKKVDKGPGFLIATPTTGWAKIGDKDVYATYRHSYHQAVVPEEVYETTMVSIFNRIHGIKGDERKVIQFVKTQLLKAPAIMKGGSDETLQQFFLQHAALETFRYLGTEKDLALIDPFLEADDFHVQISAVRAISGVRSESVNQRLMDFIEAKRYGFAKVMAVWGLKAHDAKSMLPRLRKFLADGKDEETGFGGNIMDPRVGTRLPSSVKEAIKELIEAWTRKSTNNGVRPRGIGHIVPA